jgi:type VI secretion system VasD/TssJ family lipoprotein
MKGAKTYRRAVLAALSLLILAPLPSDAKETKLKSEVAAAENINPNRRGTPQPVKLHIFYLVQDDAFLKANFGDLIDPESTVLGDELVRRTETLIGPAEMLALDEEFDEAAQFIGVVAEFTNIDEASWRAIAAVPAKKWTDVVKLFRQNKLEILIDGTSVSCAIVKG